MTVTQTPSSKKTTSPVIDEGGAILAIPENLPFLELVNNTPELSPIELYRLALSYQDVPSNIGVGNRLAFVALNAMFEHPLVKPHLSVSSQPLTQRQQPEAMPSFLCAWACSAGLTFLINRSKCRCPKKLLDHVVKRIPSAGPDLLVEVKKVNDQNTYTLLGESPA